MGWSRAGGAAEGRPGVRVRPIEGVSAPQTTTVVGQWDNPLCYAIVSRLPLG